MGGRVRTGLVGDLTDVSRLNFRRDAHKTASQCILGRGEQHLLLNLGGIGSPGRTRDKRKGGEMAVMTAGCRRRTGTYQL